MRMTWSDWSGYIEKLREINVKAGAEMTRYMVEHPDAEVSEVIEFAFALATKYGEGAAALSCEMYDALAEAQGAHVPPAEPAATATYQETARAVQGTMKNRLNSVPDTVGRLVKQAGADTTLKNALRDGAEFAWVPHGDTCAFCLMLGSNGWRRASKKAIRNGHAEHIHAHCDCTYAVRFDGKSTIKGYDPDKLLEQYENAEGDRWQDKVNSLRREQYKVDKDKINEQKRIAYRELKNLRQSVVDTPIDVTQAYFSRAKPGSGLITYDAGYDMGKHPSEVKAGQWLHDTFGGDIHLLNESDVEGIKTPDYNWSGKLWDLKNVTTEKAADSAVRHGLKQIVDNPGGIILNFGDKKPDMHTLHKILESRIKRGAVDDVDIMVVSNDQVLIIAKYKK